MSLIVEYTKAFDDNCLLEWETWFEDDTPQQQLDLLDNLVVSSDVAETMLLSGETHWSHLGWWRDVLDVMGVWARHGYLIRLRLISQWLRDTYPGGLDPDIPAILNRLGQGDTCEEFLGLCCGWPAKPEHYLSTLQWGMYDVSEFAAMDEMAEIKTAIAIKYHR